ncbi:MAG: histidinol-phosphatase [Firmicutes bacterium]|nr:histidinol-phosphatase [Bacillota bacterium]
MYDTHVHTDFSTDSKMKLEEAMAKATLDNKQLILTEHMDLNYPKPGEFIFDVNEYFKQYSQYRSDDLLLGLELGMTEECLGEGKKIVESHPFDFVLGSIHVVDNLDLYYEAFYKGKVKSEAYGKYLQAMLVCVKNFHFVDSMGHIDYIARYGRYEDKEIYYHEHAEIMDEIFRMLIANDTSIELNTRRFDKKDVIEKLLPIYKRYAELGGKHVTVGSDAHTPEAIGNAERLAKEFAESCKLKIVYYKERKIEYEKV